MAGKRVRVQPTQRTSSKGIFTSLRGGMKSLAGQGGGKKKKATFIDVLLWILVGLLALWLLYKKLA